MRVNYLDSACTKCFSSDYFLSLLFFLRCLYDLCRRCGIDPPLASKLQSATRKGVQDFPCTEQAWSARHAIDYSCACNKISSFPATAMTLSQIIHQVTATRFFFLGFIAAAIFFSPTAFFASFFACFDATSALCCDFISNCACVSFCARPRDLHGVAEEVGGS